MLVSIFRRIISISVVVVLINVHSVLTMELPTGTNGEPIEAKGVLALRRAWINQEGRRLLMSIHRNSAIEDIREALESIGEERAVIMEAALSRALTTQRVDIVGLLLDKGADVNRPFGEPIEIILSGGRRVMARGCAPLDCAKSVEMIRLLLGRGARVDIWNLLTLLQYLVESKSVARLVMERFGGIDFKVNGKTALQAAASGDRGFAVTQLLIELGASREIRDDSGNSALHHAVWGGHRETVQLLLERGAHVNARNNLNETPLDHAYEDNRPEIIRLLVQWGGVARPRPAIDREARPEQQVSGTWWCSVM